MVNILKDLVPWGLYSVKETCALLGISKATLYRYDSLGLIKHDIRVVNGRRIYRGTEIKRVFNDIV